MWWIFIIIGFVVGVVIAFLLDKVISYYSPLDADTHDAVYEECVVESDLDEEGEEESKQDIVHQEKPVQPKPIHLYVVFPEHIDKCSFSKEEWENLWWDQDEVPNSEEDGGIYRFYYEFEELFDSMDIGLITGKTIECYSLSIFNEDAYEKYPLVKRLCDLGLPEYEPSVFSMSKEEVRAYIDAAYVK